MKRKKFFLFFVLLFLLFPIAFSLSVEPFVAFQGEKVVLELGEKKAESASIEAYYNEKEFIKCAETDCPKFENGKLSIDLNGKKSAEIEIGNAKHGDYLVKVNFEDKSSLLTSFVVKPNYSLLLVLCIVFLGGLLFWVEKNGRKKQIV